MTPRELADLLDILRAKGIASAEVPTTRGTLRVVFDVQMAPMPGESPQPGGWKSPQRLDDPAQFDDVKTEAP